MYCICQNRRKNLMRTNKGELMNTEQKDKVTELLSQTRTTARRFARQLNKLQELTAEPELLDALTWFCDNLDVGNNFDSQKGNPNWRLYAIRCSIVKELNQIGLHGITSATKGDQ